MNHAAVMNRPGVLVMVSSLGCGGAEKHAISLLNSLDTGEFRLALAAIKNDGRLLEQLHTSRLTACFNLNVARGLDFGALRELRHQIDTLGIDVILCTNGYAALYAFLATRRLRRPVKLIEVFHTTVLSRWKDRLRMLAYRFVFHRCDLLVYVSEQQQAHWQQHGLRAQRERVIHNGINATYFTDTVSRDDIASLRRARGWTPDDYVIGICAALRPEKAHGDFLEALARLHRHGIAAKGLIIGEGVERPRIEAAIERLGLKSHVVITGFQADVRPAIASCEVMVLPSHAVETFSIAVLEAMSMGKPVVLSRIGGAAEQVTHGVHGLLFERGDIEALTQHLTRLHGASERVRMGRAAAARVRRQFTLDKMIAAYAEELRCMPSPAHRTCLDARVVQPE